MHFTGAQEAGYSHDETSPTIWTGAIPALLSQARHYVVTLARAKFLLPHIRGGIVGEPEATLVVFGVSTPMRNFSPQILGPISNPSVLTP
jgi:hypothetical protein